MNIDFLAEHTLRSTSRLVNQGMWLLFLVAAGLMMIVRRSAPARTGSLWLLGCALLACMLSFALRNVLRKVGHRNTENKLVNDVKNFLEREPVLPISPIKATAAIPERDTSVPSRSAGFVALKGAASYRVPGADPVVFDAFPLRESVRVKTDFYAVLQPVPQNC
jgi:hypothetical protein